MRVVLRAAAMAQQWSRSPFVRGASLVHGASLVLGVLLFSHCTTGSVRAPEPNHSPAPTPEEARAPAHGDIDAPAVPVRPPNSTDVDHEVSEPRAPLETRTFSLALEGLPAALVVTPKSMNAPLVVAAHGAGGSPEWQCPWLQTLLPATPLLLACLRGLPMLPYEGAFFYPEHHTLGKMYNQTLNALEPTLRQLGSTLHTYIGYSQGATMGALMLSEVDELPRNLLLIEGGYQGWTDKRCRAFQQRGGRRVYFACGTQTCAAAAKSVVARLSKANVEARFDWARGAGHTPDGAVGQLARQGLEWLLSAP